MKKTISYLVGTMGLCALLFVASCSDDDNGDLPPIDGYNNSNEVAEDNLVAHWTFDDTYEEDLSNAVPLAGDAGTFGTVGFEEGQVGQALKLTEGALRYPNISALNTADVLQNFTFSMWVKLNNNKGTAKEGYTVLFGLFPDGLTPETTGDFMWGNIMMAAETSWFAASNPQPDTLVLKGQFVKKNVDGSINGQDNRPDPRGNPPVGLFKKSGEWVHFAISYNASTEFFELYGNGDKIGAYADRTLGAPGNMRLNVPNSPVFGNGATKALGFENNPDQQSWSPMATASMDDVRIFNTTLSPAEIKALYNLGSAGR